MNARWGAAVSGGLVAAALAVAIVSVAGGDGSGPAAAAQTTLTPATPIAGRTITVSGHGIVTAKPDTASVWLGVSVSDDRANDALDGANQQAKALIDTLTGLGIEEADITTTGVSLSPRYDHDRVPPRIVGYDASNDLTVTIRDLSTAGHVIDAAAEAVGDSVRLGGISFSIDDTSAIIGRARAAAMADAATRASQYAVAGGVDVGTIVQISENQVSTPWPIPYALNDRAAGAESAPVPLQPGTQDLTVDVTVVYELIT